MVSGRS
ncbi:hypothetical protein AYI68_g6664, partial [Smittium mucronatum]